MITARCPQCGFEESVSEEYYGKELECPCGQTFAVGYIQVSESSFVDGNAIVKCPYCLTENNLPNEAVGRDVRCGNCNGKFRIVVKNHNANVKTIKTVDAIKGKRQMAVKESNPMVQKSIYNDQSFEVAATLASVLWFITLFGCIVWIIYALSLRFRLGGEIEQWELFCIAAPALLVAIVTYLWLAMIRAVFEIVKHLRQIRNEIAKERR